MSNLSKVCFKGGRFHTTSSNPNGYMMSHDIKWCPAISFMYLYVPQIELFYVLLLRWIPGESQVTKMSRETDGHPHWGVSQTRAPRALGLLRSLPLMASPCATWRFSLVNLGSEMNMYRAHFHSALKVVKPSNLPPIVSVQSIIRNAKGGKSCQCLNLAKLAIPCSGLLCLKNIRRQLKLVLLILLLCSLPGGMPPQAYKCCRAEQKRTYEQAFISFTVRIYTTYKSMRTGWYANILDHHASKRKAKNKHNNKHSDETDEACY